MYKKLLLSIAILMSHNAATASGEEPVSIGEKTSQVARFIWSGINPTFSLALAYSLGTLAERKAANKEDFLLLVKTVSVASGINLTTKLLAQAFGYYLHTESLDKKLTSRFEDLTAEANQANKRVENGILTEDSSLKSKIGLHMFNFQSQIAFATSLFILGAYSKYKNS